MTPIQFELSQSSSNSWHVRQTCPLALTLVTNEIMIHEMIGMWQGFQRNFELSGTSN